MYLYRELPILLIFRGLKMRKFGADIRSLEKQNLKRSRSIDSRKKTVFHG